MYNQNMFSIFLPFVLTIKRVISHIFGKILKEFKSCALIKVFLWMLQDSEYDSLWPWEYQGQQPGQHHHQSEIWTKEFTEKIVWKPYLARLLCFEVFIEESGLEMLRYLKNKLLDFFLSKFRWTTLFGKIWKDEVHCLYCPL